MMGYTKPVIVLQSGVRDLCVLKALRFAVFKTWDSLAHLLPVLPRALKTSQDRTCGYLDKAKVSGFKFLPFYYSIQCHFGGV